MPGVFVPDRDSNWYLLARHRQPLAANVVRTYIEEMTEPGDLVVDPFAASPVTNRVASECGRPAIGVESNPLVAFAARVQATPPPPREIMNALARWGEILKEGQPLQAHIQELYASECANCGRGVAIDYSIWAREPNTPVEKVYRCPDCGLRRDPATEADRARAAGIKLHGFHYYLLLERLDATESPHYNLLRELLALYTPRNLYALVTLTLKLDAELPDEATRQTLAACLLHALDVGTTLYPAPDALPERQTPDTFVEMNVWRALQDAAEGLSTNAPGLSLAESPAEVANAPGASLFIGHGSAQALAESLKHQARLVLSSPARLDPTFWQLSYLWTRWILGKTVSRALEPFLKEERQRWGWYGAALVASLRATAQILAPEGHVVMCFPAGSHAMVEALCLAAAPAFNLDSFTFRPHRGANASSEFGAVRGDYRLIWSQHETPVVSHRAPEVASKIRQGALRGAKEILSSRGEPLAHSWLHHQALALLAQDGTLAETLAAQVTARDNPFQFFHRELEAGLKEGYAEDLDHWREPGRVLWLQRKPPGGGIALSDRVERTVRQVLEEANEGAKGIAQEALEDSVLDLFPGLLTPEIELVEICSAAYADQVGGEWRKRPNEVEADLKRAADLVTRLGMLLNFQVSEETEEFDLVWREHKIVPASSGGGVQARAVWEDSHVFVFRPRLDWRALLRVPAAPLRGLIVLPETQVELAKERLRRLPMLVKQLHEAGWEFLRIPSIELLFASGTPERAELQLAFGLAPPLAEGKEQLKLF